MSVNHNFSKYYNNEKFSDFIISIKSDDDCIPPSKIWVHSIIMGSVSPLFETWFSSSLRNNNIFEITHHTVDAVEYAIKWVYGYPDEITTKEQYKNVIAVSHFLQLKLFNILANEYTFDMRIDLIYDLHFTIVEVIQMACLYSSKDLLYVAMKMCSDACRGTGEVIVDFSELTSSECTMFFTKWRRYDGYIQNIRFLSVNGRVIGLKHHLP